MQRTQENTAWKQSCFHPKLLFYLPKRDSGTSSSITIERAPSLPPILGAVMVAFPLLWSESSSEVQRGWSSGWTSPAPPCRILSTLFGCCRSDWSCLHSCERPKASRSMSFSGSVSLESPPTTLEQCAVCSVQMLVGRLYSVLLNGGNSSLKVAAIVSSGSSQQNGHRRVAFPGWSAAEHEPASHRPSFCSEASVESQASLLTPEQRAHPRLARRDRTSATSTATATAPHRTACTFPALTLLPPQAFPPLLCTGASRDQVPIAHPNLPPYFLPPHFPPTLMTTRSNLSSFLSLPVHLT